MKNNPALPGRPAAPASSPAWTLISLLAWALALGLAAYAGYLGWQRYRSPAAPASAAPAAAAPQANSTLAQPADSSRAALSADIPLPALPPAASAELSVAKHADLITQLSSRPATDIVTYTVSKGDSIFEIAARFKVSPNTVLWANYAQLNDNPDMIALGMQLRIPPVNGVLHEWQPGDSIEAIAAEYEAKLEDVLYWSGNDLDLANPAVEPGSLVMVPGGHREFRQWVIPVIPRGAAGVSKSLYGAGACDGGYGGANGTGSFVWPAGNHYLSGNDYWDGHLGIDIAAGEGAPVYAADSGVVVFSGWATGGYGYMIMIDHGNGYQTLYAHLSQTSAACGQSVGQGQTIGFSGSTGNSTGAHLHFEVRYQGGFVNPWYTLPAP